MKEKINRLYQTHTLSHKDLVDLLTNFDEEISEHLFSLARLVTQTHFGNEIYTRGLIEISSYCKNNCYYCGIRQSNQNAERYRLSKEDILACCETGYQLDFRTFVLQGGEDNFYSDEVMIDIITAIKSSFPDCALTLSLGEKKRATYQKYYDAGADRYLLRHETATDEHYRQLHPSSLSLENRKQCLYDLKEIGFQTGTGFMVGSPHQTIKHIAADLAFIQQLNPQMVGIGPFVPHKDTPFGNYSQGSLELTLLLIGILRLMLPHSLIPATTALGTIHPYGREKGILAGANVVMPNLSPKEVRKKYLLYNDKIATNEEAAESRTALQKRMEAIGYTLSNSRGDY